jgi:BirA family biotin operon repressor/biotin-[acetyl-CoA-carboxylase] ligase
MPVPHAPVDPGDLHDLARLLSARPGTGRVGDVLELHAEVDSTNRLALDRAEAGAGHGLLVVADRQSAGRGRRGRSWSSDAGESLLLSVVVRPPSSTVRWEWLPLATAVAVARAVRETVRTVPAPRVRVKWPNDVLVEGRKVSGILVERRSADGGTGSAVVGVGLNVNQERFPAELAGSATSLRMVSGRRLDRSLIAARLVDELDRAFGVWSRGDRSIRASYRDLLEGVGRPVEVRQFEDDDVVPGVLEGIDESGCLRLRTSSGERIFAAGEITFRVR